MTLICRGPYRSNRCFGGVSHTILRFDAATATRVIRSTNSNMTQTRRSGASVFTVASKSLNGPATISTYLYIGISSLPTLVEQFQLVV